MGVDALSAGSAPRAAAAFAQAAISGGAERGPALLREGVGDQPFEPEGERRSSSCAQEEAGRIPRAIRAKPVKLADGFRVQHPSDRPADHRHTDELAVQHRAEGEAVAPGWLMVTVKPGHELAGLGERHADMAELGHLRQPSPTKDEPLEQHHAFHVGGHELDVRPAAHSASSKSCAMPTQSAALTARATNMRQLRNRR